jgi:hypothetical protein
MTARITALVTRQRPRPTTVSRQHCRLRRAALAPRLIAAAVVSIALLSLSAAPASSAVSAQQQGAALLAQIQTGQTSCSKLSSSNLELMGEYDMGRIMGSTAAQNAMNAQMLASTGANGQQVAYRFMGQRLGGCATGNGPVAFGTMMGMMGTSEMGASYGSAYPAGGYGSSMMGRYGSGSSGTSTGVIAAIVLGALALLALIALIVVLVTRRTPRLPTQPRPV